MSEQPSAQNSGGFEPVLEFDTDDPEFARGFEAGRLWTLMQDDHEQLIGQPVHSVNAEMVMRMIDALGVQLRAEFTDVNTWMILDAS